jgi:hypothetical protein
MLKTFDEAGSLTSKPALVQVVAIGVAVSDSTTTPRSFWQCCSNSSNQLSANCRHALFLVAGKLQLQHPRVDGKSLWGQW